MRQVITLSTSCREDMVDITEQVEEAVRDSGIGEGLLSLYAHGATAALMIQEGWDPSVEEDVLQLLRKLAPRGVWGHDAVDGNADSHLKAGLVGPSETIPVAGGKPWLSRWQNVFFCEFDGPRRERRVICTLVPL